MAIIKNNVIMRGASGKHADQVVLRQRFGQTVVCKLPCAYPPKTAAQLANQERFKRANDFAKAAVKDPEKKAYYQSIKKPTQTAFNAAFQDAYHKPEVEVIVEEKVVIKAKSKHPITKVKVGTGYAVLNNKQWEFPLIEKPFTIKVYDVAGNICTIEIQV
ncbi:hypothetical protein GFS24_24840 [Chitinophaga sp. SYP-B3965]|uniref:hypothetical protein n=1 Tax=Chitinophaga sp. SYP-B3965 TaxID=2663120 RepID=UPI001299C03D|nr:hypothetical protein [Chitinophaga sp. SYP-B3965]MRG48367.1 hypothetical protein [Chitinophaga sp. SYP-B3965]